MEEGLLIASGYVLGSMPWGYWLPLAAKRVDIRKHGSGNVGATNVARALGFKWGIAVALLDILKGLAAGLLGRYVGDELTGVLAGTAALVGHWRPLFLGWAKGGKVVAVTGGVGLAVAPLAALAAAGVWIVLFLAVRYASLASVAGGLAFPLMAVAFGAHWAPLGFAIGAAVAILVLHRGNIVRLVRGEERRFEFSLAGKLRRLVAGRAGAV
ncbi:MAG: glycerol-3-phosphate 1-O-acyltransferase PlsY [Thermoleophilia bacterium]